MSKKGCLAGIVGPLMIVGGVGYFCATEEQRENMQNSISNVNVTSFWEEAEKADDGAVSKVDVRWRRKFEGEMKGAVTGAVAGISDEWAKLGVSQADIQKISAAVTEKNFGKTKAVTNLHNSVDNVLAQKKLTKKDLEKADERMNKILQIIREDVRDDMRKEFRKFPDAKDDVKNPEDVKNPKAPIGPVHGPVLLTHPHGQDKE